MGRSVATALAVALAVGVPARAGAQESTEAPLPPAAAAAGTAGGDDVHQGFLFRAELGFGYLAGSESLGGGSSGSASWNGLAGLAGFSIGGAVNNIVIAFHVYDAVCFSPSFSLNGTSEGTSGSKVTAAGLGPEIGYYVMPSNVYLSLTPAVTTLSVTNNNQSVSASTGYGGRFGVGYEGKVGDRWGLGVVAAASYASNNDTNGQAISTWTGAIEFSATYNSFRN
jgi:hypothetical protein